jgi:SHS2 domain-containing protein
MAMFDVITDIKKLSASGTRHLHVTGQDQPDLMVCWLRELLFLWNARELLIKDVRIDRLTENELSATVTIDAYNPEKHPIHTDIKAVTYHQIDVSRGLTGWQATIIFDL